MSKLVELRRQLGAVIDEMNDPKTIEDGAKWDDAKKRKTDLEAQITRTTEAEEARSKLALPVAEQEPSNPSTLAAAEAFGLRELLRDGKQLGRDSASPKLMEQTSRYLRMARAKLGFTPAADKHFRSFGEFLQSVSAHYTHQGAFKDVRLQMAPETFLRAPTGSSVSDPTSGGFLVQTDFELAIFMLAHDMGAILQAVNKIPIGAASNGLKIRGVDETSRATGSRWGGVQSYWVGEGTTVTPSKPKFRMIEFDLKKLMSLMWATDELLKDAAAFTAVAMQAFAEEIMFMTEDAIFEGSGAGTPLGIMSSGAKVAVAAETGQKSGTIVKENLDKMWSRMWSRSRKNAAWYINQDCEPQLNQLNQAVGTGGQLVYMPPGGISGAPYATLYGRPVVATEYNAALGTEGDIMLADFGQYTLVDKEGVEAASSMHVAFTTDEQVFRFTYRVDGRPMWAAPLTPFKGTLTKSPFITLAAR